MTLKNLWHSELKKVCIFNLRFCVQKLDVGDETNYLLQSAVNALMGKISVPLNSAVMRETGKLT